MKFFWSVIISIVISMCFSACGNSVDEHVKNTLDTTQKEDIQDGNTKMKDTQKIILGGEIVEDKGEFEGVITKEESVLEGCPMDFVIDEKLAYEIGTAVLKSIIGERKMSETNFVVYEVEGEDVFVVCRLQKKPVLGGCYSVVISKTNGAVLSAFLGE